MKQKRKEGVIDCGGTGVLVEPGYLLMVMSFATKNCRQLSEIDFAGTRDFGAQPSSAWSGNMPDANDSNSKLLCEREKR